jgi:uncharacterized membrane protein (DUF2068 family)
MNERDQGLRAIIAYKAIKAALQIGLALLLCAFWPFGWPDRLQEWSLLLRRHFTQGWASRLAVLLAYGSTHRHAAFLVLALGLDGVLTAVEGWSLHARYWWGPWLVVVATASFVPIEIYHFLRMPRPSRALLFLLNVLIAAYLARRAWREHRKRRGHSP